ncbi:MAG: DNA gyrase subunit A [Planctomycetes bacterium]|jgi:DNA gyrase subunit A|nr:DNA gyrase subunit A [Planctomycetota bacterium]
MLENESRITDLQIETELSESYLTYAMSTIMDRALPDVRDGLKPSQRRILVAMNDLQLGPRSKHRKCAKIAGDTSGNYHPHGEAVIYPTLVRMAQSWNMRHLLVDGQGNFGSLDGDPPAAMRYTEARMAEAAAEMMEDLKEDTVDFIPNYDEVRMEPTVLPSKFPNLLVNGSQGIAVGMATSLPPHNLREVCDGIIKLIDEPACTARDLMKIVKGPDFPTGGVICGRSGIVEGYETGRGKVTVRGRVHTEQLKGGKEQIVINEIPYQVLKKTIIESIADQVKEERIKDISDVRDESDREHAVRVVVELKRDADPNVVINQLYQFTPLQSTISIINIALVNRQPRTLSLRDMIELFIAHRKEVIRRRTAFRLKKARQRAHILEGLILALADIHTEEVHGKSTGGKIEAMGVIELLRNRKISPDVPTAKANLMRKRFTIDEALTWKAAIPKAFKKRIDQATAEIGGMLLSAAQADAILSMQLQRLVGLEIDKLTEEYNKLVSEIEDYELILSDDKRVLDIIREDTIELKEKYGDDRRTQITNDATDINIEDLIADEQVVVTISHEGYIKRMPLDTYRKQGRGGRGVVGADSKEGDFIEHLFIGSTHDYLMFFTNLGRCYWQKVYDVPQMSRQSKGRSIANLVEMQADEKLAAVLVVRDFTDEAKHLVMTTAKGIIKKTLLKAYGNPMKRGIIAIGLDKGDSVIGVGVTNGKDQIVLATRGGMAVRFEETEVRDMGRQAGGVKGVELEKDDEVVEMVIVPQGLDHGDNQVTLLTACEHGYGKRTRVEEYRLTHRGGKGVINIRTTDRNGPVVSVKPVTDNDELMMITRNGQVVRIGVTGELREMGRATQGVRLIRLDEGDILVNVARVAPEDKDNDTPLLDAAGK